MESLYVLMCVSYLLISIFPNATNCGPQLWSWILFYTSLFMIWSYDDRNAAALLEKGATIYILLRLQGTFDKKVVALEDRNVSDRLSINILPEILWEKLDSQSISYPMNNIDYFCNVLFL